MFKTAQVEALLEAARDCEKDGDMVAAKKLRARAKKLDPDHWCAAWKGK